MKTNNVLRFEVPRKVQLREFVKYWSEAYDYGNERLYSNNIGKTLTPKRLRELYFWKNGGNLSRLKKISVEKHYVSRISKLKNISNGREWLKQFGHRRAIWDIFFLHIWNQKFPIFDQHVYRAMKYIQTGKLCELPKNEDAKIEIYFEEYLSFFQSLQAELRSRENQKLDRALWRFGKFLKR